MLGQRAIHPFLENMCSFQVIFFITKHEEPLIKVKTRPASVCMCAQEPPLIEYQYILLDPGIDSPQRITSQFCHERSNGSICLLKN